MGRTLITQDDVITDQIEDEGVEEAAEEIEETAVDSEEAETVDTVNEELEDVNKDSSEEEPSEEEPSEEETSSDLPEWAQVYTKEFEESGTLSEASIDKIVEDRGIPKKMVEDHVAMARELQKVKSQTLAEAKQTFSKSIHETAGGEDNYSKMLEFARENYTEAEVAAFDKAISSEDAALAQMAVTSLKTRYEAKHGPARKSPKQFKGGAKSTVGQAIKPFKDDAAIVKAMSDKRYDESPAYRKMVDARLAVTP